MQFGRTEFHIRPADDSPDKEDYHRNGYTGYGEHPSVHQKELETRISRKHELFKPPVYEKEVKFGHVDSGQCFFTIANSCSTYVFLIFVR